LKFILSGGDVQHPTVLAKFLAIFLDLAGHADFSPAAVHADYSQLKEMKLLLACCHLSFDG